jgi:hypothetical protein
MSSELDTNKLEQSIHSSGLDFIHYLKFRGGCSDAPRTLSLPQKKLVRKLLTDPVLPQHEAIFSERDLRSPLVQRGMAYAVSKMLQIGDPKSFVLGVPVEYQAASLVTFCRRDDFAQLASVLILGIGELGMDFADAVDAAGREAVDNDPRLKHWKFGSFAEAQGFVNGISRTLFSEDYHQYLAIQSRGYNELQQNALDAEDDYDRAVATNDPKYIEATRVFLQNAERLQSQQIFAIHNISFAIKFSLVFNHLYPEADSETRRTALQHIGVSPDFPWFSASTINSDIYPAILEGFSNLNSPTAFMYNQIPQAETVSESRAG